MCKQKPSNKSRRLSPLQRRSRWFFVAGIIGAGIAVLLVLPGCASTASVVEAFSKDTNAVHLTVQSPFGSLTLDRNGRP